MADTERATAAGIPYEDTDCTADEAVEAVEAVRATAATCDCAEHPMAPHMLGEPPCVQAPRCPDCFSVHCDGAVGAPCGEPNTDPYYAGLPSHPDA